MTEPRVPRLPVEQAKSASASAGVPEYMADLNVFQVLLQHPRLAGAFNGMLAVLLYHGRLDVRLRELIIMRIGWVTGSVYEWTQHWGVATSQGVDPQDLLAVRDWERHQCWGPADRAVLAATDATLAGEALSPATWAACQAALGKDPQLLLEVVAVIGLWQMASGLLRSLEIPLEEGVQPWPPDGRMP